VSRDKKNAPNLLKAKAKKKSGGGAIPWKRQSIILGGREKKTTRPEQTNSPNPDKRTLPISGHSTNCAKKASDGAEQVPASNGNLCQGFYSR